MQTEAERDIWLRDRLVDNVREYRNMIADEPRAEAILGPLIVKFEEHLAEVTARIEETTNG